MSELADVLSCDREKRIDDMLTHYSDVQDTLDKGGLGSGEFGRGYLQMPDVWRRSGYPTLEQLLRELRRVKPDSVEMATLAAAGQSLSLYGHVREWYFRCQRVQRPIWETTGRKDKHNRPVYRLDRKGQRIQRVLKGREQFQIEVVRSTLCAADRVRVAVTWVAGRWPEGARMQPERVDEIAKRLDDERRKLRAA